MTELILLVLLTLVVFLAFAALELRTDWAIEWTKRGAAPWRDYFGYGSLGLASALLFSGGIAQYSPLAGPALFFFGWCLTTILWADNRRLSAVHTAWWMMLGSAALTIGSLLSFTQSVGLLAFCSSGFIAAGFVVCLIHGKLLNFDGRLGGASNPNILAQYCVLAIFCFTYLDGIGMVAPSVSIPVLSVVIAALGLTRSRTALQSYLLTGLLYLLLSPGMVAGFAWLFSVCVYLVLSLFVIHDRRATYPRVSLSSWMAIGDKDGLVVQLVTTILSMGRPTGEVNELSGRRTLWTTLIPYVRARLARGYGYGGFWTIARSRAIADWQPRSAHSVYIDTMLNTGLIGILLYGFIFADATQRMFTSAAHVSHLLAVYLITQALWGIMESTLIRPQYITFSVLLLLFSAF